MPDIFQLGADLGEIAKAVASAEDKMRLAEASMALGELASENRRLRDENATLRERLSRRKNLEYRDGHYYVMLKDGTMDGPICPRCYEDRGHIHRLQLDTHGNLVCVTCRTEYNAGGFGEYDPGPGVVVL